MKSKIKEIIAWVLPLLAAEIAWAAAFCIAKAVSDRSCVSEECSEELTAE